MIYFQKINFTRTFGSLDRFKSKALPFALANALTQTAKQASQASKEDLHKVFTLRNTWTEKGMRFKPASKYDASPEAWVIAANWYLDLQEFGGEKIAHEGRKYIAVPLRGSLGISQTELIPRYLRPVNSKGEGSAFMKAHSFIMQLKDGRKFIFIREGAGRGKGRYSSIIPAYILIHEAHVRGVLNFEKNTRQRVEGWFPKNFEDAFQAAIKTAW